MVQPVGWKPLIPFQNRYDLHCIFRDIVSPNKTSNRHPPISMPKVAHAFPALGEYRLETDLTNLSCCGRDFSISSQLNCTEKS